MRRYLLLHYLLLFCSISVSAQKVIETYYRGGFNNKGEIRLLDNGTFVHVSTARSCVVTEKKWQSISRNETRGTYKQQGNNLIFYPTIHDFKGYKDSVATTVKHSHHIRDYAFFQTDYLIVEYDSIKLLFTKQLPSDRNQIEQRFDNHFLYYANELNKRDTTIALQQEGWRNISLQEQRHVLLNKDIRDIYPEMYKRYILNSPLELSVTDRQEVDFIDPARNYDKVQQRYLIRFDIGRRQGIRPGMIVYPKASNLRSQCPVIIENVFENSCEGFLSIRKHSPECSNFEAYSTAIHQE